MADEVKQIIHIGEPLFFSEENIITSPVQFGDGSEMVVAIPVSEIGMLISYLARLNEFLSEQGVSGLRPPTADIDGPIKVHGLGFQPGPSAHDTYMVVDLAGCRLGLALDNTRLASLADGISRIARTLSASPERRH